MILTELGINAGIVTQCFSRGGTQAEEDAFNRFRYPDSPHRIVLLVDKGKEGWDCPPLFACALAREIKGSNNLILQMSTRCLRQLPGNAHPARIYLSEKNLRVLDAQFQQTYGITLEETARITPAKSRRIVLCKADPAPLEMDYETHSVRLKPDYRPEEITIAFTSLPREVHTYERFAGTVADATGKIQLRAGEQAEAQELRFAPRTVAARLARQYGLAFFPLCRQLEQLAGGTDYTASETSLLCGQIEAALGDRFEEEVRRVRVCLALVKKEGFQTDEQGNHYAEIRYMPDREHLICDRNGEALGFHYTPYNFDSADEKEFFYELLAAAGESPESIEDIYYTGAISSPEKTDFWFWYKGVDDKWHRYTPDFLFRRKDGRMLIVEIKPQGDTEENLVTQQKEKKLREIETHNPGTVQFEIVEGFSRLVQTPQLARVRKFTA